MIRTLYIKTEFLKMDLHHRKTYNEIIVTYMNIKENPFRKTMLMMVKAAIMDLGCGVLVKQDTEQIHQMRC